MPKCTFLIGIPCSGKTTWREKNSKGKAVLCRDDIRMQLNGGKYIYTPTVEDRVSEIFRKIANAISNSGVDVIIDNTNLRIKYIEQIKGMFPGYEFKYIYFPISLWKANLRNIIRKIKTGKWIPFKVMKGMYNQYKNIENEYMVHK